MSSLPRFLAISALLFGVTVSLGGARADQIPAGSSGENVKDRADATKPAPSAPASGERNVKPVLWPLRISYVNTRQSTTIRLYDASGKVDKTAAAQIDELLCDVRDPAHPRMTTLDRRTLQLLFRAAYHFRARDVEVISGYRKPGRRPEGRHGEGRAIDFRLPKVRAAALAAYLRTLPRVGVGLYTHRATQFVHLDSRERSYHWLDPSPPGVSMPERPLGGGDLAKRDATYAPTDDLPEAGVEPPPDPPSTEAPPAPAAVAANPDDRPTVVQMVAQAIGVKTEP